ncbi:MAG TPA: hypothetical protein PK239_11765 [Chitinophagales bacterium]|nr:hypothetical protein [Chitinophagales bacterium]
MIGKYLTIFSDPFFWIMVAIATFLGYLVYKYYVIGNTGVSEEEDRLYALLKLHGLTYLRSQTQTQAIPSSLPGAILQGKGIYTYRTVSAQKSTGEQVEFWACFEYQNGMLAHVYWLPDLKQTAGV